MASREQKKRKQSAKFYLTALDVIDPTPVLGGQEEGDMLLK